MVKVGGKNTRKVCKKLLNFLKTEVENFGDRGEIKKFRASEGKCSKTGKIGGKS